MLSSETLEFIKTNFAIGVYLVTLLIAIFTYKKYFDTAIRFFPIIITYTLFNELLGHLIRYSEQFAFLEDNAYANDLIYNIYDLFYYGFFYVLYWRLIKKQEFKQVIKVFSIVVLGVYIVSCFFQNPLEISLFYATSLASIIMVLVVVLYWLDRSSEWRWHIEKYNLMTWVSLGLITFHTVFPVLFMIGYLNVELWENYGLQTILRVMILIMYGLFCIGLVVCRRKSFK